MGKETSAVGFPKLSGHGHKCRVKFADEMQQSIVKVQEQVRKLGRMAQRIPEPHELIPRERQVYISEVKTNKPHEHLNQQDLSWMGNHALGLTHPPVLPLAATCGDIANQIKLSKLNKSDQNLLSGNLPSLISTSIIL